MFWKPMTIREKKTVILIKINSILIFLFSTYFHVKKLPLILSWAIHNEVLTCQWVDAPWTRAAKSVKHSYEPKKLNYEPFSSTCGFRPWLKN